jgi:hypothetical protein
MKKIVLIFGVISGVISSLLMLATVPFADKIGFDRAEVVGYTVLVLSFLLVFFGIRSYRDNVGHGEITFTKGLVVGILITLISSVFYVAAWEFVSIHFFPDFMDKYAAYMVAKLKASGASQAAIDARVVEMNKYKEMYNNPFWNAAMTFIEPLPVGVVITLLSAAVLKKKRQPNAATQSAMSAPC